MGRSSKLYNKDLAPTSSSEKKWGWFEIFNVWANDVPKFIWIYTAAHIIISSIRFKWLGCISCINSAGFFIMYLAKKSGKPSVKHGVSYPVFARVSMGVFTVQTF